MSLLSPRMFAVTELNIKQEPADDSSFPDLMRQKNETNALETCCLCEEGKRLQEMLARHFKIAHSGKIDFNVSQQSRKLLFIVLQMSVLSCRLQVSANVPKASSCNQR